MAVLLIVEDDTATNEAICEYMSSAGHTTLSAFDGEQGLQIAREKSIDLVVLDIMLPKRTGLEVLKELRQTSGIPVLMLTALDDEPTQAASFDEQADDYITKPFEMREVIARIHAVMRRFDDDDAPAKLEYDNLIIDKESYNIVVKGQKMEIPPKEIELLYFLASSPNRVFTRSQLLDDVWGFDYFGDTRTVDVHIKRLREKLSGVSDKWELKTVWGVGYKFETKN